MNHYDDQRIVVTLDAGGTNFVFGAMQGCRYVVGPLTLASQADNLDRCLSVFVEGFRRIIDTLPQAPSAISFAFPGPADYYNGIVGGFLPNFPSFRDGVALGPYLSEMFGLPVFINNDGDLFAFGEAAAGVLPEINRRLEVMGSTRRYRNLLGYTFGTGLGIGSVIDGRLNLGNNSCVETFCLPSIYNPRIMAEDYSSIRAVVREFEALGGEHGLTPKDIFDIAESSRSGDAEAARESFRRFGREAGDVMATAVTLTDSIVVVGGGLTGAIRYIMPGILEVMRSDIHTLGGDTLKRLQMKVYDLDDESEFDMFLKGESRKLNVYGTDRVVEYDPQKRTGICVSRLGASQAISIGAYTYALSRLDNA